MVVSASRFVSHDKIAGFVKKTAPRILKRLRSLKQIDDQSLVPDEIKHGNTIRFLGTDHTIDIQHGYSQNMLASNGMLTLKVTGPYHQDVIPFGSFDVLRADYANSFFKKRLDELAKKLYPGISALLKVRKMKARFGTCYPDRKLIVLNLFLIHTDPACIDYVIVHELIHFEIPNHGRQFYSLLSSYYPEWKKQKAKLSSFAPFLRGLI